PEGMILVSRDGGVYVQRSEIREVYDVSGAGDTVVATLAAALAAGVPLIAAVRLANIAAGIVVGKVGTAVAYAGEIAAVLDGTHQQATEKALPRAQALDVVERWRRKGLRIGFTNGCFDLLHPGHVGLLARAKAACDRLIVALNSDASTARLKGPSRPVQSELARAAVLASLAAVDLIVVFEEDTPDELIRAIRPHLLVKGADYSLDQVVGAEFVKSIGGEVLLTELTAGYSTSATIARLAG
ncbi:MAG: D-glycero-beta-D-manno-heptose 1-phosphate adenylyltransferase, partial [Stellaceae bacterium]